MQYPVLTFSSGPTNSMRGAVFLSGLRNAIVVDIGGTTTDVGVLKDGFPREASSQLKVRMKVYYSASHRQLTNPSFSNRDWRSANQLLYAGRAEYCPRWRVGDSMELGHREYRDKHSTDSLV